MDGILYSIVLEDGKAPKEGRKFILDKKSGILRLNLSNPSLNNMIGEHNLKVKVITPTTFYFNTSFFTTQCLTVRVGYRLHNPWKT